MVDLCKMYRTNLGKHKLKIWNPNHSNFYLDAKRRFDYYATMMRAYFTDDHVQLPMQLLDAEFAMLGVEDFEETNPETDVEDADAISNHGDDFYKDTIPENDSNDGADFYNDMDENEYHDILNALDSMCESIVSFNWL